MDKAELERIGEQARAASVPIMKDSGLAFLVAWIEGHAGIRRILEVGTAVGWSAMHMAQVRPDITVDTLEIDPERAAEAEANIRACGLAGQVNVHVGDALDYRAEGIYDLIFIDAAKSQYRRYLEHFFPNSRKGTFFVFDNLCFHGMVDDESLTENRSTIQMVHKIKRFRNWLLVEPRFATEYRPDVGDGVAIARRIR